MGIVNQAVQDTVSNRGIADLLMPVRHRRLRSEDQGTALIAVVADFQEVAPLGIFQRRHGKVIQQQHVNSCQAQEKAADAPVGMGRRQLPE